MTKLQLFDIDVIHDKLVEKAKTFIDPATIPDPENPEAPAATLLFEDRVVKELPLKVSGYGGKLAHITLESTPQINEEELGGPEIAVFSGGLYLWLQGKGKDVTSISERYIDISRAYFKNKDLLGISGCNISIPKKNVMKFVKVPLVDPGSKTPKIYTLSSVIFNVEKELSNTVYTL